MRHMRACLREEQGRNLFRLALCIAALMTGAIALADATIPTVDKAGSKDNHKEQIWQYIDGLTYCLLKT